MALAESSTTDDAALGRRRWRGAPGDGRAGRRWLGAVTRSWEGRIGCVLGLVMLLVIVAGPAIRPYGPTDLQVGPASAPPSGAHLLGTDDLGRDVLSRVLSGGGSVLLVPLLSVTIALAIGIALGLLGAYRGGVTDIAVSRFFDLLMALPPLLIVLVIIAGLGTSIAVVVLTVALVNAPRIGRVVRAAALPVVGSDYVAAARLRGETSLRILAREVLVNISGPVLVVYALYLTYGIVFISSLNFLGLGAQPPSSDWGLMVSEARKFFISNPLGALAPAFGIAALSLAFTLLADAFARQLARGSDQGQEVL